VTASGPKDWDVVVRVPCRAEYARVVRTAAAACAVLEDFSVDGLGDVRLLVDEVFMAMRDLGVDRLQLRLAPDHDELMLEIIADDPLVEAQEMPDLTFVSAVINEIAHHVDLELASARPRFAATISKT
jgi:hypothetical protein